MAAALEDGLGRFTGVVALDVGEDTTRFTPLTSTFAVPPGIVRKPSFATRWFGGRSAGARVAC